MTEQAETPGSIAREAAKLIVDALTPTIDQLQAEIREAKREFFLELRSMKSQNNVDRSSAELHLDGIQRELKTLKERVENMGQVDRLEANAMTVSLNGHSSTLRTIGENLYELKDDTRVIIDRLDRAQVPDN